MKHRGFFFVVILECIYILPTFAAWDSPYQFAAKRDPIQWPFADTSIWNLAIHKNAKYVPANIGVATDFGMTTDEDLIFLTPKAPMVNLIENTAYWDFSKTRCTALTDKVLYQVPIPDSFFTDPGYLGHTPNHSAAFLMPDGHTIKQNQPFHRCSPKGVATSQVIDLLGDPFLDADLYGMGAEGAHGGSGMSSLGGTLRIGELVPGAPPIHHAIKINLAPMEAKMFRWPAITSDYGGRKSETWDFSGANVNLEGALFALPPSINIKTIGLETEPAKYIARVFQDYGGYLVDGTGWNVYAIETEWGPAGRMIDEFKKTWGFPFHDPDTNTAWSKDMRKIFMSLNVVINAARDSIAGGPNQDWVNRRAPKAPGFVTSTSVHATASKGAHSKNTSTIKNGQLYFWDAKTNRILRADGKRL